VLLGDVEEMLAEIVNESETAAAFAPPTVSLEERREASALLCPCARAQRLQKRRTKPCVAAQIALPPAFAGCIATSTSIRVRWQPRDEGDGEPVYQLTVFPSRAAAENVEHGLDIYKGYVVLLAARVLTVHRGSLK
jgi:hypothetical protein